MTPIAGQENCAKCGERLVSAEVLASYRSAGQTGNMEIEIKCPRCGHINEILLKKLAEE